VRALLNKYRRRLVNYESVMAYSLLGVIGGLASGIVVLGFELAIAQAASWFGAGEQGENFEALPRWMAFALPTGGALLLGLCYQRLPPETREAGIVHVISRLHSHYGALPLRNALVQFFGGAFALATGQSGGREGPGVHLGGAVNSQLGQRLGLPNNSLRVLIACGTAGGIAAAFHTPLAGVIFAMEVIIAEYTVVGFVPVMLSAVSASAVSRTLSSTGALFTIPDLELQSLFEIPLVIILGFVCGLASVAFIRLSETTARLSHLPIALRFTLAGLLTGLIALWVPQILGVGYDTLDAILLGQLGAGTLLIIGLCKLTATAISCGAGMPIGLIGPNLFVGACLGGALGISGGLWQPGLASEPTLYVILGMGASMAAVLNAPLAAILAVIELTDSTSLGMPAMLAIVAATLTNTGIFKGRSAHLTALRRLQRAVPDDPISKMLHSTDVSSIMDQRVVHVPTELTEQDMEPLLEFTPTWCIVTRGGEELYLVSGAELLAWVQGKLADSPSCDLTESDIRRWTLSQVPIQATLRQAMDVMRNSTTESVSVVERSPNSGKLILCGVLSRENIEKYYLGRL
jgi:chloride channel protein, CIC family